jgi:hypothetical protein
MTRHADYARQIEALSTHLDLAKYDGKNAREFMQIVLDD